MSFKDDLAAAKAAVAEEVTTSPVIEVAVNGTIYPVLFHRASPEDWSHATTKHLPREDVGLDLKNGYNLSAATREISVKYGRVLEGNVETTRDAGEWADLWEIIAPAKARNLEAVVWYLHEKDAEQEIEAAKKGSKRGPASRKKSG